jgi:hypothetical protein
MTMEVNIKLKLRPVTVPNFVSVDEPAHPREEGIGEGHKFAITELDAEVLEALCVQFRADLFKNAGKTDPEHERPQPSPFYCQNCGGR